MLEQAIDAGTFVPGRARWRQIQAEQVQTWLTSPHLAHQGATPQQVITAERHGRWLAGMSPDQYAVLAPILPLPEEPPTLPDDTAHPLRWLLTTVGDGLKLTQAGYLPPTVVEQSKQWYADWLLPGFATRKEIDLPPLLILREWAQAAKMIRARKGTLLLTPLGRAMLAGPGTFAAAVVDAWFSPRDAVACAGEVAAATLLRGRASASTLAATVHTAIRDRFRLSSGGVPSLRDSEHVLWEWLRPGSSLGLVSSQHTLGEYELTDDGRAAATAGLVRRAHAPRRNLG